MNYGKTSYSLISITTQITLPEVMLMADVNIPTPPKGIIILAQTFSHEFKNIPVINELLRNQFGVVEVNLFTKQELLSGISVNDLEVITGRLIGVTKWVKRVFAEGEMSLGLWGFGKGAAAVLKASIELEDMVKVIVCREGRTDLVSDIINKVTAPTLLIVDELNKELIKLNKLAQQIAPAVEKLLIIKDDSLSSYKTNTTEVRESVKWIDQNICNEVHFMNALA